MLEGEAAVFSGESDVSSDGEQELFFGIDEESFVAQDVFESFVELVDVERFFDVVGYVVFHGHHGGVHGWVSGEDDDGDIGIEAANFFEDFHSVKFGHHDVKDNDVEFFFTQCIQALSRACKGCDVIAALCE